MNPFLTDIRNRDGKRLMAYGVDAQLRMLRSFTAKQCQAALKLRVVGLTVRKALTRRMRQLARGVNP